MGCLPITLLVQGNVSSASVDNLLLKIAVTAKPRDGSTAILFLFQQDYGRESQLDRWMWLNIVIVPYIAKTALSHQTITLIKNNQTGYWDLLIIKAFHSASIQISLLILNIWNF